jgi:hypothetical protein
MYHKITILKGPRTLFIIMAKTFSIYMIHQLISFA